MAEWVVGDGLLTGIRSQLGWRLHRDNPLSQSLCFSMLPGLSCPTRCLVTSIT
jgi:hypothetical protein